MSMPLRPPNSASRNTLESFELSFSSHRQGPPSRGIGGRAMGFTAKGPLESRHQTDDNARAVPKVDTSVTSPPDVMLCHRQRPARARHEKPHREAGVQCIHRLYSVIRHPAHTLAHYCICACTRRQRAWLPAARAGSFRGCLGASTPGNGSPAVNAVHTFLIHRITHSSSDILVCQIQHGLPLMLVITNHVISCVVVHHRTVNHRPGGQP
ncbi:hypothetical protein F4780DRAFT_328143 [Xylariomycetidae sp. FL0641]|nr:hypothetical protein F4780DRAFT_328143 [Xylariomycetidae sp. FL0641]